MPVAQLSYQDGEYATCEQKPAKMSEGVRYRENGCLAAGCSRDYLKSLQMYAHRVCVGVDDMTEDCGNGRLVSTRIEAGIGQKLGIFGLPVQPQRCCRPCCRNRSRKAPEHVEDARSVDALPWRH